MECRKLQEKIDLYLDGQLSDGEEGKALEKHCSECPSCSSLLSRRQKLLASLKGLREVQPALPPMDTYLAQLRNRIKVQQRPKFWQKFTLNFNPALGYAFAGVVAAIVVVVSLTAITGEKPMTMAMPERDSYIEFLELPTKDATASTFVNHQTQTTVVWINGIEVKEPSRPAKGES